MRYLISSMKTDGVIASLTTIANGESSGELREAIPKEAFRTATRWICAGADLPKKAAKTSAIYWKYTMKLRSF